MKIKLISIVAILLMQGFVHFTTSSDDIEKPIIVEAEPIPTPTSTPIVEMVEIENEFDEQIVVEEALQEEISIEECCTTNRWGIELTEEEIEMLAKIIFLEAHTQSEDGISAAIEVVFNRMVSDQFPDTLEGVLSQDNPLQFVTWEFVEKGTPTDKEYNMIYAALNGEKEVLSMDYVFFSRGKQNENDPIKIDDHWFCKSYYWGE